MDDASLVEAWRSRRDETALAALMERHSAGLRAALRRRLADPAAIEDALQATWIVFSRKAVAVRDPARLVGWLHRCAGRIALDLQRAATRRAAAEARAGTPAAALDADDDVGDERAWLRRQLDDALQRVSPASREAILRHYLHGQPRPVAAAECGVSEGAFQMRLDYGLKQLRTQLARRRGIGMTGLLAALAAAAPGSEAGGAPTVASILHPAAAPAALAQKCITAMLMPLLLKTAAGLAAVLLAASVALTAETSPTPAPERGATPSGNGPRASTPAPAGNAAPGTPAPAPAADPLDQLVTADFQDLPLRDCLAFLQRATGLTFDIARIGDRLDTGVTLKVTGMQLRNVLDYLTRLNGLTWKADGRTIRFAAP